MVELYREAMRAKGMFNKKEIDAYIEDARRKKAKVPKIMFLKRRYYRQIVDALLYLREGAPD